ncbi:capsid cement protein [Stenotrophomonas sp. PS02298]|uniref:capsid cement protein n=1 Tax=Stenotrophomonas sp. PS02298 TaxID=2991424 RepID=UPI00249B597F|nr:capsid cement protein [Stenotrophomonas sp. PS02298]
MTQNVSLLTLSLVATAAIVAERFTAVAGVPATAAGNTLGVAKSSAAIGEVYPVEVVGTAIVTAGAAIAKGAAIEVGTAGKAITKASGVTVARALQAATADGDRIEVLLIPN